MTNLLIIFSGSLNIMSKLIKSYETIMIARFISGLACGFFTGVLPIYIYEIAPKNIRGLTGTMNQLIITCAILTTNILGMPGFLGTEKLWPVLLGVCFLPVISHVFLIFGVKSPKYLFMKYNDRDAAEKILTKLRGSNNLILVKRTYRV